MDYQIFELGHVSLQRGATLRDAKLAYNWCFAKSG